MLTRFYIYRFLIYFYLWLPVSVLYKQEIAGLTLSQITGMGAVAWVVSAIAEVPTGLVADVWGRRISLAAGALLYGIAFLGNGLSTAFWVLLAFGILQTVAFTFISGADVAWLYDTLKAAGREEEFVRHQGRGMAVMYAAQGAGALLGSPLGLVGLGLPYVVAGLLTIAAAVVALTLRETAVAPATATARRSPWAALSETVRLTRDSKELRYTICYSASTYVAPFLLFYILFQPYAQAIGLPPAWMGFGLVLLRAVSLVGGQWADSARKRVGETAILWGAPAAVAIAITGMAVAPMLGSLLLLAGVMLLNAIHRPVLSAVLNRQVESGIRATVLSTVNLLSMLLVAAVQPVMGAVAEHGSIPAMLGALGVTAALAGYVPLAFWRPGLTPRALRATPAAN